MNVLEILKAKPSTDRWLKDGIYEVPEGVKYISVDIYDNAENVVRQVEDFTSKYPDTYKLGSAYETGWLFVFSDDLLEFDGGYDGTQFNYGCTALLTNCPNRILILAEND